MTGAQLVQRELDAAHKNPKAKCPFVPQREMVKKLWGTDSDPLAHKSDWERQLEKASRHHHGKQAVKTETIQLDWDRTLKNLAQSLDPEIDSGRAYFVRLFAMK